MNTSTTTLDVRQDILNGREPFSNIMGALARLAPGGNLLLIAPFEPTPLFHVLVKHGFTHQIQKSAPGFCQVLITRGSSQTSAGEQPAPKCGCESSASAPSTIIELDARGLEPPQPLVMILESLPSLTEGAELRAQTDRKPMHLYAQLEERGFVGVTEETENGSFITRIRRN